MPEGLLRGRVDEDGLRLDQAVARCFSTLGRRAARAAVEEGRVFVDGRRCRVLGRTVQVGAQLLVHPPRGQRASPPPSVLYEDEAWIVVNKPAGVVVNETETSAETSLVEQLADRKARVVHRLDRDTTGVLVFAKGVEAAAELSAAFADRSVKKTYVAIVEGEGFDGTVEAPLGRARRRPRARAVVDGGQPSSTDVRVLARKGGLALVEARPVTGRTHQIRVHLAHRQSPIVGDALYGGPTAVRLEEAIVRPERPLLHAFEIVLVSAAGERGFRAPLPADLERFVGWFGVPFPP